MTTTRRERLKKTLAKNKSNSSKADAESAPVEAKGVEKKDSGEPTSEVKRIISLLILKEMFAPAIIECNMLLAREKDKEDVDVLFFLAEAYKGIGKKDLHDETQEKIKNIFIKNYVTEHAQNAEHKASVEKIAGIAYEGILYYKKGNLLKAFDLLTEVVNLNKNDTESKILYIILIKKLELHKLYHQAVVDLTHLIEKSPTQPNLYFLKMDLQILLNNASEARETFSSAVAYDDGLSDDHFSISRQTNREELLRFAINCPHDIEDKKELRELKRSEKVAEATKKMATKKTDAARRADLDLALKAANDAIALDVFNPKAYMLLGKANQMLGHASKAVNPYRMGRWVDLYWNAKRNTDVDYYYENIINALIEVPDIKEATEERYRWIAFKRKTNSASEKEVEKINRKFAALLPRKADEPVLSAGGPPKEEVKHAAQKSASVDARIDEAIALYLQGKEQEVLVIFSDLQKEDSSHCERIVNKVLEEAKKHPAQASPESAKIAISMLKIIVVLDDARLDSVSPSSEFKDMKNHPEKFHHVVYSQLADAYEATKEHQLAVEILNKALKRWRYLLGFQRGVSSVNAGKLKREITVFEKKLSELNKEKQAVAVVKKAESKDSPKPLKSKKYDFGTDEKDNAKYNPLSQEYKDKKAEEKRQKEQEARLKAQQKAHEKKAAVAAAKKAEEAKIEADKKQKEKIADAIQESAEKELKKLQDIPVKKSDHVALFLFKEQKEEAKQEVKVAEEFLRKPFFDTQEYAPCLTGLKHLAPVVNVLTILCGDKKENAAFITGSAPLNMLLQKINQIKARVTKTMMSGIYIDLKDDVNIVTDLPGKLILERLSSLGVKESARSGLYGLELKNTDGRTIRIKIEESDYSTLQQDKQRRVYRAMAFMLDAEGNLFDLDYSTFKRPVVDAAGKKHEPFPYLFEQHCLGHAVDVEGMPDCGLRDLVFNGRVQTVASPRKLFAEDPSRIFQGEKIEYVYGLKIGSSIKAAMKLYYQHIPQMKNTEKLHEWLRENFQAPFVSPEEAQKNAHFFMRCNILKKMFGSAIFPADETNFGWVYEELAKCPPTLQSIYMIIYVYCLSEKVSKDVMFQQAAHMADAFNKYPEDDFNRLFKECGKSLQIFMVRASEAKMQMLRGRQTAGYFQPAPVDAPTQASTLSSEFKLS